MIVMPAIDLRDGACVQLVGGSYDDERVRLPDPVAAARRWIDAGFRSVHVVDLDAATGRGSNAATISRLLADGASVAWQVGGGVRAAERIDALLAAGATRVVVGTRALESFTWLAEQAERWPGRLVLAIAGRDGRAATHGWTRTLPDAPEALLREAALPLAGVLVTAIDVEGRQAGCDLKLIDRVRSATDLPVIASGGVSGWRDLEALDAQGVWAAVIGMALYTHTLDARRVAERYGGTNGP